jgi:succinylarginine dihydrolase
VVCVGTDTCLFHHERAFEDTPATHEAIRRAADGLFDPVFVVVPEAHLSLEDAVASYLFNSQLLRAPGEDRLLLLAPSEVRENPRARAVAEGLVAGNGPIGRVQYVDVRQSMRNGGGPACLRLRLALTEAERSQVNPDQVFDARLHAELQAWVEARYRDRLAPEDLADPALLTESRSALDELTRILGLRGDFYPFQQV